MDIISVLCGALEPFCDKTHIESELYPCTNSHGKTNRYFKRIYG